MFCFHLNAGIQKFSSFIRPVDGFSPIYCQQTFLPHNGIFSQISFCWTSNQIVAKIPKTTVTESRLFLFARAFSPFSSFFSRAEAAPYIKVSDKGVKHTFMAVHNQYWAFGLRYASKDLSSLKFIGGDCEGECLEAWSRSVCS